MKSFLKIGSLQKFIQSEGPIENFSSDMFEIDEIHKIAILDLRMLNLDRNECNILVQIIEEDMDVKDMLSLDTDYQPKLKRKLIPIDHGLSIPDTLALCSYDLIWLSYSQAEQPFSAKSLAYIADIDIMADIKMLEDHFKFRP